MGFLNPKGRLPQRSKFEGKEGRGLGTQASDHTADGSLFTPLHSRPQRAANLGQRGRGSGCGNEEPGCWPEPLCSCVYAAGTLHG